MNDRAHRSGAASAAKGADQGAGQSAEPRWTRSPNIKTYVRPMSGWWRRNPFYLWYMLREASSVFITAYAALLLWGLARLAQGKPAFDAWIEALRSPLLIALHVVALVLVIYHAWTWFKVMPKTMPFISLGGRRVADRAIVASGVAAAIAVSVIIFAAIWWTRP
jgi:fumarate reductase subunit C